MWSNAYRGKNIEFQYHMNDGWVKAVDEERDLGVLISKELNSQNNVYWQKIRLI